jgi:hypothetical protein
MRNIFSHIVLIVVVLRPGWSRADATNQQNVTYAQVLETRSQGVIFRNVEMIGRNHSVGPSRSENLHLDKMIYISNRAFFGLDTDGRVLQILQLLDRQIAVNLSGDHKMAFMFLRGEKTLLAIDERGEVFSFDWDKWMKSDLKKSVRRAATRGALTWLAVNFAAALAAHALPNSGLVATVLGISALGIAMIEAFNVRLAFVRQNHLANGFESSGLSIKDLYDVERVLSTCGDFLVDYRMHARDRSISLEEFLRDWLPLKKSSGRHFDITPEHELLLRWRPAQFEEDTLHAETSP